MQPLERKPLPALNSIAFTDERVHVRSSLSSVNFVRDLGMNHWAHYEVLFWQGLVLNDRVLELELLDVQVNCDSEGSRWRQL